MKSSLERLNGFANRRTMFFLTLLLALAFALTATTWFNSGSSKAASLMPAPRAGDACTNATIINPTALPFTENATTEGANNDLDPTSSGCANGAGLDVVYAFTPAVTGVYALGVTPLNNSNFDPSLYIVTDCSNPTGSCVAGVNANSVGKGEVLTTNLNAGTQYFIVVDSPIFGGAGPFHFSLRRGGPTNDTCETPTIIDPARLPFSAMGTTVGANNDLNPQTPCLRSNQSGRGADVVYQFTSPDSQNYQVTVTPVGNYDVSVYILTNCATNAACTSGDVGGSGVAESVRRNLTAGTTYFIVVDGFGTDAGDFTITLEPTIPIAPPAPTDLRVTAVTSSRVDLAWTDNSINEQGFKVERSLDGQTFTEIATVAANVTTYSDTTVAPSTLYFYRVFAFNNFGNSQPTNVVDATTPTPPPPPLPLISVSPDPVDFGTVRTTATATVTIANTGGAALVITEITNPAAPFSIVNKPALPLTIAAGQTALLTVQFAPLSSQVFSGSFVIRSNASNTAEATVNLRGIGSAVPVANLDVPTSLVDFQGSSTFIFEVKNTGDADLIISSIFTPTAPFSLSGAPAFPATFKPGESALLTIAFAPPAIGVFQGSFTIISNDPDSLLSVIYLKGTSTTSSEALKLRVPLQVTAVAGATTTINVVAVNGTNSDIRLTATAASGGTFTDRGNGKGDMVLNLPTTASGRFLITYRATDGANRLKTGQSVVNIVAAADTHNVQVTLQAPQVAPNAPANVFAFDQSFTQLALGGLEGDNLAPQDAAGLTTYLVYRSDNPGVQATPNNLVGMFAAGQSAYLDRVPVAATSAKVFYYVVTALYASGTESAASGETSNAPRLLNPRYKKKQLSFTATNSNIGIGAVVIVDGRESFPLTRSGELIVVEKNATSTPGRLMQKGLVQSGSRLQIRNPNGALSAPVTL
ncbi:MAG: choice-of-anchor D domain-containing protein [Acidobacteria bacterium]|nr:choice-of-anchor D domain-containing protein [Acidobacteriota bacterium]